ncbi:MAG: TatD family hydrolase [Bacteroidota bacterium]
MNKKYINRQMNNSFQYIDIHTHKLSNNNNILTIHNLLPGELSYNEENLFSAGLHPWYIKENWKSQVLEIEKYLSKKNVIAVGECGLDKLKGPSLALQVEVFNYQDEIANHFKKPMIIHCVKAYDVILSERKKKKEKTNWIIHGFNSSPEMAFQLIELDCYLSLGENALNNQSKLRESLQDLPLDNLFLETDENNLTIEDLYYQLAGAKNISLEKLSGNIKKNFMNVFG